MPSDLGASPLRQHSPVCSLLLPLLAPGSCFFHLKKNSLLTRFHTFCFSPFLSNLSQSGPHLLFYFLATPFPLNPLLLGPCSNLLPSGGQSRAHPGFQGPEPPFLHLGGLWALLCFLVAPALCNHPWTFVPPLTLGWALAGSAPLPQAAAFMLDFSQLDPGLCFRPSFSDLFLFWKARHGPGILSSSSSHASS